MHGTLLGKNILIVEGSVIATPEVQEALHQEGARAFIAHKVAAAFELLRRLRFDGAILDQGLHNEAFDLCEALQAKNIPYISCVIPHRLQSWRARKSDAEHTVWKLAHVLSRVDETASGLVGPDQIERELHSH
jgi:hypothetical protein